MVTILLGGKFAPSHVDSQRIEVEDQRDGCQDFALFWSQVRNNPNCKSKDHSTTLASAAKAAFRFSVQTSKILISFDISYKPSS